METIITILQYACVICGALSAAPLMFAGPILMCANLEGGEKELEKAGNTLAACFVVFLASAVVALFVFMLPAWGVYSL